MALNRKMRRSASRAAGAARPAAVLGAASALLSAGAAHALDPHALPQGPSVVGGAATFSQTGAALSVNQSTARTVIDWRGFDIGSAAQTTFNQPGAGAIAVNRVNASANPTQIEGSLKANGQVWILNPNGVLFGKTARVDVAGLVASTANIDPTRFMAGDTRLILTGADRGFVANDGAITVADNGLAAFVAPSVRNSGAINARVGKVALAAGSTFTLDLAGDRLVEIGLGAGHAVVDQSGSIVDEGGVVTLSARSAGQVVDSVINMSGVVSTASARLVGGQIVLEGDATTVAGTLDASGTSGGRITLAANTIAVGPQAVLRADSLANGDGGTISAIAAVQGDYAGSYSARGGPSGGAGGKIETSGARVAVDGAIKVDASAAKGAAGEWLIDPLDVTITSGAGGGLTGSTVTAGAIQTTLAGGTGVHITTDQTGTDNGDLTLASSINATSTGNAGLTLDGRHLSAAGGSTINIAGGALTLNVNTVNTLADVSAQPTNWIQDADNMIGAVSGGTRINLGAATYANSAVIDRSNVFLDGSSGALINVNPGNAQVLGLGIGAGTSGVTINGFKIVGEITGSYVDYAFGLGSSRGIAAVQGATGFHITNNTIQNVRTGLLVDGRDVSGASITGNLIDNTKTAVFLQYTAGSGINITGNSQGPFGNEWGENFHVNGDYNGTTLITAPGGDAPSNVQAALLAGKAANGGWSVQDQAYATSNRTNVVVATTGSDANQGSPKSPLASIQNAIPAVVAGGEIDVANGTYVSTQTTGYININKPLALIGQSQAGVIIDARTGQQYGLRVTAPSNVTLRNLTVWGVVASPGYGVKIETITGLNVSNVTSQGAFKSEFDLNSVTNGVLDHLTANGAPVGGGINTGGNGISISDSQNVTLTNSTTLNNGWGGLALYQANSGAGAGLLQETNITVAASNSFSEPVPVYAEDTSTINDFGTLNIGGFPYIVRATTNPLDMVTVFQPTQQAAIDYAVAVSPSTAWIQGYGSGIVGNNIFTVGTASGGGKLTLTAAYNAATSGATINVLNGAYTLASQFNIAKSLSLIGAGVGATTITSTSPVYGINVTADNVHLSGFTFNAPTAVGNTYGIKVTPDTNLASDRLLGFNIDHVTINGGYRTGLDLNGALGATIDNVSVSNVVHGNGIALTDSANVTITNTTTGNDAWGGLALYQTNTFYNQQVSGISVNASNSFNDVIPVYAEVQSTTQNIGSVSLAGFNYVVKSPNLANDVYTWFQKTQQAAIDFSTNAALGNGNVNLTTAAVQGYAGSGIAGNNIFTVGVGGNGAAMSIKAALDTAQTGATVNVNNGTYVIPAGGTNYLDISTSLTLKGQSQAGTIIDASGATAYGLRVQGDNVTLSNFTLLGSKVVGGYGVKVEPLNLADPNSRIQHFAIDHVTIDGAAKNTLDLNGALVATIDNVTAKNAVAGNGIALIDSANVTITNSATSNNAWGGLRIEEKNASFNQQTNAVTVAANNSFTEASPVYLEDDSASQNFGTVNLAGFNYAVKSPTNPADVFTWFQKTQQGAVDFAAAQSLTAATVQSYSGSGFGDNVYTVGVSTGGQALSIQAAFNAVQSGGAINIGPGTYAQNVTDGVRANVNFSGSTLGGFTLASGASGSGLSGALAAGVITLNAPVTLLGNLTLDTSAAGGTITTGTIDGSSAGGQALALKAGSGQISLGALGSGTRLGALQVSAGRANLGGGITAASIAINGPATLQTGLALDTSAANGAITMGTIDGSSAGGQALTLNAGSGQVSLAALGSGTRLGALQVSAGRANLGGGVTASSIALNGAATLQTSLTLDTSAVGGAITIGTIDGASAGGQALTVNAGSGQVSLATLGGTTRLGAVQVSAGRANLGGGITAASIALNGPATLQTGLTLDTSAANGAITTGTIDGAGAGGQALALNAGGGSIALGSLGASTRLGAVQAASSTTLTGDTYNAASLTFGGDLVLTAAQTTVNTAPTAGNITVAGSLLGSSDGAQSLALTAGSGTGGANGDISLQNVGAKAVRLNNLSVSGDDFGAQTVDIAGDFTAKLTGNQVFSSHTLNAGGQVNSTVGGNASGPINGGQAVTFAVSGSLTGAIQGTNIALNAGTLTGATVTASQSANVSATSVVGSTVAASQNLTVAANSVSGSSLSSSQTTNINTGSMTGSSVAGGQNLTVAATSVSGSNLSSNQSVNLSAGTVSGGTVAAPTVTATATSFNSNVSASSTANISGGDISGAFSGGSFKLAGTGSVNASVNATSLAVDTPKGTLTGAWQSLNTGSSGSSVLINSQATGLNPGQLVVETFTLPTRSTVQPSGQIVLPAGQVISLLSPAGASGTPKLIQVQTVQDLGSLLTQGYTAIVIDLSEQGASAGS